MISHRKKTLTQLLKQVTPYSNHSNVTFAHLKLLEALATHVNADQFYVDGNFSSILWSIAQRMANHYQSRFDLIIHDAQNKGDFYQSMISSLTKAGYLSGIKLSRECDTRAHLTFYNERQQILFFAWMGTKAVSPATYKNHNTTKPLFQFDEEKMGSNVVALTTYKTKKNSLAISFASCEEVTLFFILLNMTKPAVVDSEIPLVLYIPTLQYQDNELYFQVSQRLTSAADYLEWLKVRNEWIQTVLSASGLGVSVLIDIILQYCVSDQEMQKLATEATRQNYLSSGLKAVLEGRKAALLATLPASHFNSSQQQSNNERPVGEKQERSFTSSLM